MPETDTGMQIPTVEPHEGAEGFFDLLPDVDRLPVRVVRAGAPNREVAAVRMLVAAALVGCVLFSGSAPANLEAAIFGVVVFGCLGLLNAAVLLRALTLKTSWTLRGDRVEFKEQWLLRCKAWIEPLTSYRGVVAKHGEGGGREQPLHVLMLVHAHSKRRNVVLTRSPSPAGLRKAQGRYARLFGLPGLIETESGLEERAPDDVDRTVRERVVAGTLPDSFDPVSPPSGSRLRVAIEDDTLVLRVHRGLGMAGILAPAILLLTGSLIAAVGFAPHRPTGLRTMSVAFLAAGALAAVGLNIFTEELRVSPSLISKCWRPLWGGAFGTRRARAEDVTDVVIAKTIGPIRTSRTVQMVADATVLHFGGALGHAAKFWVRDCIIAVISK